MSTNDTIAPQLTFRAIALSIVLAMVLAAANTYLGLFAGMTIASAIPAAVVSMAVLRVLGGGGMLENNIVQTGASAGSSIASGVIFTIPALVILGFWQDFEYAWVLTIAGLGGILGVLFSVPLRRALVVEQKLAFPEGQAAADHVRSYRPGRPGGPCRHARGHGAGPGSLGLGRRTAPHHRALRAGGKSLLPIGVQEVLGEFSRGEVVSCLDAEGHEIARGLVNYPAQDARRIAGHASAEIEALLGYVEEQELIHRDNLVLL